MIAAGQIRSYIERVERLREQIAELNSDVRDIYAEAKGNGYDVSAIKHLINERARDPKKAQELETIVDLYRDALLGTERATRAPVHDAPSKQSPSTASNVPASGSGEPASLPPSPPSIPAGGAGSTPSDDLTIPKILDRRGELRAVR